MKLKIALSRKVSETDKFSLSSCKCGATIGNSVGIFSIKSVVEELAESIAI